jgi:CRISPR-associated protein Csx3
MNLLPAILIGGPPHSGKTVLSYSLSQFLRERKLTHYLMRAAPDGEGNWSQEIPDKFLNDIRFKGQWTPRWTQVVCRDVAARTLPLLVDIGGKPTDEQLSIFDQCTGAVLITPNDGARQAWRRMIQSRGLPIIADLHSELAGDDRLDAASDGAIMGTLAGLQRGDGVRAKGPAFDALAECIAALFTFPDDRVRRANLAAAPVDVTLVDFGELAQRMYPSDPKHRFVAENIEAILAASPSDEPIAAYGVIPSWLAASLGARRSLAWQFDVRLGWVRTPRLAPVASLGAANDNDWLSFDISPLPDGWTRLSVGKREYYLDHAAIDGLRVPAFDAAARVQIHGPLPLWLFAAFGHAYAGCADVTADQPQRPTISI